MKSIAVLKRLNADYVAQLRQASRTPTASEATPRLLDYVERSLPGWARFDYFAPYAEAFEGALGKELEICFSAPPGHGKTSFTLHGLLWICRYFPGYSHAYVTYSLQQARDVSKDFVLIARRLGFKLTGTLDKVELTFGDAKPTTIIFSSVKGRLTGRPITGICIIDDFLKDQEAARSKAHREAGIRWWLSVASTRRHVGTSYIVMATRWPGGDLTDYLLRQEGFRYINLKAIAEPDGPDDLDPETGIVLSDPLGRKRGESLSPLKPPSFFARYRKHVYWWVAMFQGQPRPEGMGVFAAPGTVDDLGNQVGARYYRELPKDGYRVAYGVDLAYSQRTQADWSICIEGWAAGGYLYIVNVLRKQVTAPNFLLTLLACKTNRPGAPFRFYASGTEKGSADFIKQKLGRIFRTWPATGDKLVRCTPASLTWNEGNILLPDPAHIEAPWLDDFLAVVVSFTGTPGEQDDDVDALAAIHDELMKRNRMFSALTKK